MPKITLGGNEVGELQSFEFGDPDRAGWVSYATLKQSENLFDLVINMNGNEQDQITIKDCRLSGDITACGTTENGAVTYNMTIASKNIRENIYEMFRWQQAIGEMTLVVERPGGARVIIKGMGFLREVIVGEMLKLEISVTQ